MLNKPSIFYATKKKSKANQKGPGTGVSVLQGAGAVLVAIINWGIVSSEQSLTGSEGLSLRDEGRTIQAKG